MMRWTIVCWLFSASTWFLAQMRLLHRASTTRTDIYLARDFDPLTVLKSLRGELSHLAIPATWGASFPARIGARIGSAKPEG